MFAIWRACERFGIKPPGIQDEWDEIDWWHQELLMAYSTVRESDELDIASLGLPKQL